MSTDPTPFNEQPGREEVVDRFLARSIAGPYTAEVHVVQQYAVDPDGTEVPTRQSAHTAEGLHCEPVPGEEGVFEVANLGIRIKDVRY